MELFILLLLVNQTILLSGNVSEDVLFSEDWLFGGEETILLNNLSLAQEIIVLTDDLSLMNGSCKTFFVNNTIHNFTLTQHNKTTFFSESSCKDCFEDALMSCSLVDEPSSCSLTLAVDVSSSYVLGETIRFTPLLEHTQEEFSITYWWTDYFNNTLRNAFTTKNLNTKQYTPNYLLEQPFDVITLHLSAENTCNNTYVFEHVLIHNPFFEKKEEPEEEPAQELTICNTTVAIDVPVRLSAGETIRFTPKTNVVQKDFVLRYWFENTLGELVREPLETNNLNTKQYTPPVSLTRDQQDLVLVLRMSLENDCVLAVANETIVVTNKEYAPETVSTESIIQQTNTQELAQEQKPVLTLVILDEVDESFNATITIYNDAFSAQEYFLAAYPYRHSTNFSSRTPELVIVPARTTLNINRSFTLEPGNYSFKTQLWPPNRRTPIEERTTIMVQETVFSQEEGVVQELVKQEVLVARTQEPTVVLPARIEQPITGYTILDRAHEYKDAGLFFALIAGVLLWVVAFVMRRRNGGYEEKIL